MKIRSLLSFTFAAIWAIYSVHAQEIPIQYLDMTLDKDKKEHTSLVLENEIAGIKVEHITLTDDIIKTEYMEKEYRFIYLFLKGKGLVSDGSKHYDVVSESILVPSSVKKLTISAVNKDTLHVVKITSTLTEQDLLDLKEFPKENTEKTYFAKFTDCEAYTEAIKSPNTVSRTVLPNKYLPRIAMGTVETTGPDKVDPHEHAMLEQLFLGLSDNDVIVFADDAQIDFPANSILHIPLGSSHSVKVEKGKKMYYMWMDFFLDKKGEEWLKTHKPIEEDSKKVK